MTRLNLMDAKNSRSAVVKGKKYFSYMYIVYNNAKLKGTNINNTCVLLSGFQNHFPHGIL